MTNKPHIPIDNGIYGEIIRTKVEEEGYKVIPSEQFQSIFKKLSAVRQNNIYGDDTSRLDNIYKKYSENIINQAVSTIKERGLGIETLEDLLYMFYKIYWNTDNLSGFSHDRKLKIKGNFKLRINHLLFSIKGNEQAEIFLSLSRIQFILSTQYYHQLQLDGTLGKEGFQTTENLKDIIMLLQNNYSSIYESVINNLSENNNFKQIRIILANISNNRNDFNNQEKEKVYEIFIDLRDRGLEYNIVGEKNYPDIQLLCGLYENLLMFWNKHNFIIHQ